jgi:hypothetical protein
MRVCDWQAQSLLSDSFYLNLLLDIDTVPVLGSVVSSFHRSRGHPGTECIKTAALLLAVLDCQPRLLNVTSRAPAIALSSAEVQIV